MEYNIIATYDYNWCNKCKAFYTHRIENADAYISPEKNMKNLIFYDDNIKYESIHVRIKMLSQEQVEPIEVSLPNFVKNLAKEITKLKISGCEKCEVEPFVNQKFKEFVNQKLGKLGE